MRNTIIKTGNKVNELTNEYNNSVKSLFENWKKDYLNDINNCLNIEECHEEHLVFFKNIIFNRLVEEIRGFNWLNADELRRTIFYKHLRAIRINKKIAYDFMNRSIDGKRLNAFEGDIIPEVYAGAVWEFYKWLTEDNKDHTKALINGTIENVKEIGPLLDLSSGQSYTGLQLAFYYYYSNSPYTSQNRDRRAIYYGLSSKYLMNTNSSFLTKHLDSDYSTTNWQRYFATKNLYESMLKHICDEAEIQKAKLFLSTLEKKYMKAKKDGIYSKG